MNRIARRHALLALLAVALAWTSCVPLSGGAGARDTKSASGIPLTAMYGLDGGKELSFLVLVHFPTPSVSTKTSSKWRGSAVHSSGIGVDYEASASEITINGGTFELKHGRVFIVKREAGNTHLHQLKTPISTGPFGPEVTRIAALSEVEAALK